MSNNYQLAFAPDLQMDAAEFVAQWNATPECRQVAEAQMVATPKTTFFEPVTSATAALAGVLAGLATHALYDLIKDFLKKRKKDFPDIEIKEIQQLPDGKRLLVITIKEGAKSK